MWERRAWRGTWPQAGAVPPRERKRTAGRSRPGAVGSDCGARGGSEAAKGEWEDAVGRLVKRSGWRGTCVSRCRDTRVADGECGATGTSEGQQGDRLGDCGAKGGERSREWQGGCVVNGEERRARRAGCVSSRRAPRSRLAARGRSRPGAGGDVRRRGTCRLAESTWRAVWPQAHGVTGAGVGWPMRYGRPCSSQSRLPMEYGPHCGECQRERA